RSRRMPAIVGLVILAEIALVLFGAVPAEWKVAAIFLNGLPLGLVWGLFVQYLEGRRTSDFLLSGLACSFVVASGVFKDVGRAMLAGDLLPLFGVHMPNPFPPLSEFWMPAAAGLLFAPAFLLAIWLLNQMPEPTLEDRTERTEREPMDAARRREFLRTYLPGMLLLIVAYVLLTTFREYRDNYMVDILDQLGYSYAASTGIMTRIELGVALGVLGVMSLLFMVKDNRRALLAVFFVIAAGFVLIGIATLLHARGAIDGFWWMTLIGLGGYMAYVPYNSVLFDRLMASTHFVGTAVFAIYLADSAGYTGNIVTQLGKDLIARNTTRAQFLSAFSIVVSITGLVCMLAAGIYFWHSIKSAVSPPPSADAE
ncbi:MAG TPA: DUF5690 family protein, partial [Lacipirellulaceae bacterium]|nr:DUF5690 family protein [Lacipirellulaceae bacterium]